MKIIRPLVFIGLLFVPSIVTSQYWLHLLILSGVYILLTLGLNLIIGYTGQISLGHASFYGLGAYTAALLSTTCGFPFWFNLLASMVVAGVFGVLLGLPTIRLAGHYLAIASLAFGIIIEQVFVNWVGLTRGPMGINDIRPPRIDLLNFEFTEKRHYYYLILAIVLVVLLFFRRLVSYRTGRAFAAIRENEISAQAMGINTVYYKIMAFSIAGMVAGAAGCFYAHYIQFVSPDSFSFLESINIMILTIVGGTGNILGSLIGSVLLTVGLEYMRVLEGAREIVYGVLLLVIIIFMPKGISGFLYGLRDRYFRKEADGAR